MLDGLGEAEDGREGGRRDELGVVHMLFLLCIVPLGWCCLQSGSYSRARPAFVSFSPLSLWKRKRPKRLAPEINRAQMRPAGLVRPVRLGGRDEISTGSFGTGQPTISGSLIEEVGSSLRGLNVCDRPVTWPLRWLSPLGGFVPWHGLLWSGETSMGCSSNRTHTVGN